MTPEEINIAIAEICGFTVVNNMLCNVIPDKNGDPELESVGYLPNYYESLDAMYDAEKTLGANEEKYMEILYRDVKIDSYVLISDGEHDFSGYFSISHVTAYERAEAFLRVYKKWKE